MWEAKIRTFFQSIAFFMPKFSHFCTLISFLCNFLPIFNHLTLCLRKSIGTFHCSQHIGTQEIHKILIICVYLKLTALSSV